MLDGVRQNPLFLNHSFLDLPQTLKGVQKGIVLKVPFRAFRSESGTSCPENTSGGFRSSAGNIKTSFILSKWHYPQSPQLSNPILWNRVPYSSHKLCSAPLRLRLSSRDLPSVPHQVRLPLRQLRSVPHEVRLSPRQLRSVFL